MNRKVGLMLHNGTTIDLGRISVKVQSVSFKTTRHWIKIPQKYKDIHPYMLKIKKFKYPIVSMDIYEEGKDLILSIVCGEAVFKWF